MKIIFQNILLTKTTEAIQQEKEKDFHLFFSLPGKKSGYQPCTFLGQYAAFVIGAVAIRQVKQAQHTAHRPLPWIRRAPLSPLPLWAKLPGSISGRHTRCTIPGSPLTLRSRTPLQTCRELSQTCRRQGICCSGRKRSSTAAVSGSEIRNELPKLPWLRRAGIAGKPLTG